MLAALRKNVRIWSKIALWPVIIAFIVTIFFAWGMGGSSDRSPDSFVAVVNGTEISHSEYQMAYEAVRRMYENIYRQFPGNSPDENQLRQASLQNVIDEIILLQEAEKLGLHMSDDELRARIESEPAFQRNGKFSPQLYQTILNSQRIPPAVFETQMRRDILSGFVRDLIVQTAKVSEAEITEELKNRNDKATLDTMILDTSKMTDEIQITDEDIQKYYDENQETYRRPEQYRLRYIEIKPETFKAEIQIAPAVIEAYYDERMMNSKLLRKFMRGTFSSTLTKELLRKSRLLLKRRLRKSSSSLMPEQILPSWPSNSHRTNPMQSKVEISVFSSVDGWCQNLMKWPSLLRRERSAILSGHNLEFI